MMLQVEVPLPPAELSANRIKTTFYHRRAELSREYRQLVHALARNEAMSLGWQRPAKARVSLLFGIAGPSRDHGCRPRDVDNAIACFKAGFDALTDAGIIVDDDYRHMMLGAVEIDPGQGPWVRVSVEKVEPPQA